MWSLGIVNEDGFREGLLYCFDVLERGIEQELFLEDTINALCQSIVRRLAALGHAW